MGCHRYSRRKFLGLSAGAAVSMPCMMQRTQAELTRPLSNLVFGQGSANQLKDAKVAIVRCLNYGAEVYPAMKRMFGLLGGIQKLVANKTVTVKLNMTGARFSPHLGRPVGETYMTHPDTAMALLHLLMDAGARRVRFVESTPLREKLEATLSRGEWDIRAFQAFKKPVEFENTRNLGKGKHYSHVKVSGSGYIFSSFELNQSYEKTDVFISLCKLKEHFTAGVTLTMKNLFGITPNSLYGSEAGSERATRGRDSLHYISEYDHLELPGIKPEQRRYSDRGYNVPHIIADVNAARPVHLGIIDGITAMSGGENPKRDERRSLLQFTAPGVMVAGFNPVSTDAVGTAVMGFDNPRAPRGSWPFENCDNHLVLAEKAGVGIADLDQIDVRGMSIDEAVFPY